MTQINMDESTMPIHLPLFDILKVEKETRSLCAAAKTPSA